MISRVTDGDTDKTYAFLDIGPLSKGHCLLIPKCLLHPSDLLADRPDHGERLHDVPEEHLSELLPLATRLAKALDVQGALRTPYTLADRADYNILQVRSLLRRTG